MSSESYWYFDPNKKDQFWRTWSERYLYEPLLVEPVHMNGLDRRSHDGQSSYILPKELQHRVLGGEACCWGHCMGSKNNNEFNTYVWLPLSAVSERLWSSQDTRNILNAKTRLRRFLSILERRFNFNFFGNSNVDLSQSFAFHSRTSDQIFSRL